MFLLGHISEVRFPVSKVRMVCLVIDALKCLMSKFQRVGWGGHYTFNKVLPHESHRDMQAYNLVTEQWSERFMAGY